MIRNKMSMRMGIAAICALAAVTSGLQLFAAPNGRGRDEAGAKPVMVALPKTAPQGAVILFSGKPDEIKSNFYRRRSMDPGSWTVDADGVATPNKVDLTTKLEVKDCLMHVEFRCPADANGNPVGGGNSGIGLHGRYEIQILNSFGKAPESHECGALYSQKAPLVIASKRAGEWQTYDIIFRAPRFNDKDEVVEKPRATVFQNGILVQNNEEFNGPTGIQYEVYKGMAKTGPIVIQGDHDAVQFRNIWIVPM